MHPTLDHTITNCLNLDVHMRIMNNCFLYLMVMNIVIADLCNKIVCASNANVDSSTP